MADAKRSNGSHPETGGGRQPLFYARPEPITPESFKGRSLRRNAGYAFARGTNVVPLNAVEFGVAQRHYPIVFAAGEEPMPRAVLGVRNKQNLFVDQNGRWTPRTYIPAYVRRYPFIFIGGLKQGELVLGADTGGKHVAADASNPFFKDGKPSPFVAEAGKFCTEYQKEHERTRRFCAALEEHELLESKNMELSLTTGEKLSVGPLLLVKAEALAALPDAVVLDWHKRGLLPIVHAHLLSMNNWPELVHRASAR
jgi:hypothetical protein